MNKIIAIAVLVCGLSGMANASTSGNVAVMEGTVTVKAVSISSSVATDVCPASIVIPDRTTLTLQNIDTTYDVNCAASINDLALSNYFILYAGGGSVTFNVRPYSPLNRVDMKIYCKTTSTVGSTNISVIQGY